MSDKFVKVKGKKIPKDLYDEILSLRQKLTKCDYEYYVLNNPTISDKDYDVMYYRLEKLEESYPEMYNPNSPTQRVGGAVSGEFTKVKFDEPMLSLDKVRNSVSDLFGGFYNRKDVNKTKLIGEHKLDGLTLVIEWNHGELVSAVTRGNGYIGEDVTHTARTIRNLPLQIKYKGRLVVRGEAVILNKDFDFINNALMEMNMPPYSTSRNLASGSLRQLDPQVCYGRRLMFYAYDIVYMDNMEYINDDDCLIGLSMLQIPTVPYEVLSSEKDIENYVKRMERNRNNDKIPYKIDGLVFKVLNLDIRKKLGNGTKYPKWAMAYKFEDDVYETKLLDIEWNVSRTRRINPVAIIETVNIDGTDVSRATLNNLDFIRELELGIGDTILVKKANEVIPNIVDNLTCSNSYKMPKTCPECGEKLGKKGAYIYCTNKDCTGAKLYKFAHFVSRGAMNIKGLSYSKLHDLISNGFVKEFYDLYDIKKYKKEIIALEGWGEQSYLKLFSSIDNSRIITLDRFIYALGIPTLGYESAYALCEYCEWDIDKIMNITVGELLSINDFGTITSQTVYKYLQNNKNKLVINEFIKRGILEFEEYEEIILSSNKLENMVVCFTGVLANPRSYYADLVVNNGGEFVDSITKKVTHLVVGDNAGSKVNEAEKKGINIMTENELLSLLIGDGNE